MKTSYLWLVFIAFTFCCQSDRFTPEIYDVKYCNETADDLEIVTYIGKNIIDRFKIKSNRKRVFYNTEIWYDTRSKSSVLKSIDGGLRRDSILVVKQKEVNASGSHKLYIKLISSAESKTYLFRDDIMYNEIYIFENLKPKTFRNFIPRVYSIIFDEEYFKNSLKMYDYEKRGL